MMASEWVEQLIRVFYMLVDTAGVMILFRRIPRRRLEAKRLSAAVLVVAVGIAVRFCGQLNAALFLISLGLLLSLYEVGRLSNAIYLACLFTVLSRVGRYLIFGVLQPASVTDDGIWMITVPVRMIVMLLFSGYMHEVLEAEKKWLDYVFLGVGYLQMAFARYAARVAVDKTLINMAITLMCIATIMAIYALLYRIRIGAREREMIAIRETVKHQQMYFEYRAEITEIVARQCHDMKQQLLGLYALSDKEKMRTAIRELTGVAEEFQSIYRTGSDMMDVILSEKAREARRKGVEFAAFVDFSEGGFVHRVDLCAIVGNALDNAIEAASEVSEAEKRCVTIKAAKIKGYLVIRVQNYFSAPRRRRGDTFLSTKTDDREHGIGLASIRSSAARYGGRCVAQTVDDQFVLEVFLPAAEPAENL